MDGSEDVQGAEPARRSGDNQTRRLHALLWLRLLEYSNGTSNEHTLVLTDNAKTMSTHYKEMLHKSLIMQARLCVLYVL